MDCNLSRLKSGTDIRGVALGENVELTDGVIGAVCAAFVKWLSLKSGRKNFKIAVGHDSRLSSERILRAAAGAILNSGSDVVYTGLSSTPSMFILLKRDFGCDASVMITASHMPKDKNGLKFFTPDGGLDGKDIDEILKIAESGELLHGNGKYSEKSFMDEYSAILVDKVRKSCGADKPLAGKKIIVDAGNGAGGFFAEKVLLPLGADISGSLYLEPDGNFPNHIPNPEDKGAIDGFAREVVKAKADLGIIFDTDVDRAGCVDGDGREINRNTLIALISSVLLKERRGVIVTDSVTSEGLTEFICARGGEHLRFKRGYKNVIDKCKELNDGGVYSPLAIETSGHAAFKENYFLDDGAYLITRLLPELARLEKGKRLCDAIAELKMPVEEAEVRVTFSDKSRDFKAEGKALIEELRAIARSSDGLHAAEKEYEGVRIYFDGEGDGWALVRQSVHDPVLPINFESNSQGGVKYMAEKVYTLLRGKDFLNVGNLQKFLNMD